MTCLVVEIIMILGGLYAFIKAKLNLTDRFYLEGWRARVVGLFWMAPMPVAFLAALAAGILIAMGVLPQSVKVYVAFIEPVVVIGAIIGSIVFAHVTE
jgi:hypothetical protein